MELDIEYPQHTPDLPIEEWPRVRGTFQMEMAPLSLTPIAVNLFLQQVHHKLWNGCSFVINAMHILQAGPHRYNINADKGQGQYNANLPELVSKFENSRLDKMPFQEYSDEFPHVKWTVGYAGRPGGPDFYINKIDNSVNHGPGGQSHHDLHEEADPCFAKLVGGMEIIDELNKIPIDYNKGALLQNSVMIVDSRVVASREGEDEKGDEQIINGSVGKSSEERKNNGGNNSGENDNAAAAAGGENNQGNVENDRFQRGNAGVKMPAMGPSPGI